MMETLAASAPNDPANLRQLGVAHQKLGNTLGNPNAPNVGDFAGALTHLERSAAIFREALAAYPTNAVFRRNLGIVHSNTADVLLAITESDLATSVGRGENAGRRLGHVGVARTLSVIGAAAGETFKAEPSVSIDGGWRREKLRAVVFVQERASKRVLGAASIKLVG